MAYVSQHEQKPRNVAGRVVPAANSDIDHLPEYFDCAIARGPLFFAG
jgi:hypothetical protein